MRFNSIEMKLYEILGINLFRGGVFKLEKLLHRKDKGRNTNYHIASIEPQSADGFIKYLFYNGAIHARNILFFLVLFAVRYIVFRSVSVIDILLWLLFLKDCYCVMLQRYNFLRISIRKRRLDEKYAARIQRKAAAIDGTDLYLTSDERDKDLQLIQAMLSAMDGRNSIIIGQEETNAFIRFGMILQNKKGER